MVEDEKELKEFNEAKKSRAFGKSKFSRRTNNNLVYNLPELKGVLN